MSIAHRTSQIEHPRWPAEWEPLDAVWVVPPHNPETWPGCLDEAQQQHAAWCEAMATAVRVRTTDELGIATNDSWVRDFGPLFVLQTHPDQQTPSLTVHDFRFNGWGDKYETRSLDDAVAAQVGQALGLTVHHHDTVLEGGALETNGQGTLLTTTDCLLNPSRNGPITRDAVEALLHQTLGITDTLWLTAPADHLTSDDTDGHVDNLARFINADTVAVHPALDATPLRDAGLNILKLPAAGGLFYDFPPDRFGPGGRETLPASYANFLIANGHVFLPTFGLPTDDEASRLLDDAMPDHRIVPIRAEHLVVGLGSLHCLSMQQPSLT